MACSARAQQPQTAAASSNATQAERDKQARLEFEHGRKAFDEGDYRGAWSFFHNAYRLSNRAQLLYNIGQTADRLGHDSEALTAFRMYLERLPKADNRRDVENRIRALEERVKEARRAPGPPQGDSAKPIQALPETTASQASSPPPAAMIALPPPPPPEPAEPRPTRHGVYLRLALGAGVRSDGVSGGAEGTLSGAGFAGEFAVGTTLLPGFVVGGAIYSDLASSPTFENEDGKEFKLGSAHLTMIGPIADWYLDPKVNGLHFQAALTFGVLSVDYVEAVRVSIGRSASGIGAVLGAGYEWPVANEWAVGALARLTLASLSDDTASHGVFAASLLGSVTWY